MLDFQTTLIRLLQRSILLIGASLAVIPAHAEWIVDTGPGGTVPGPALTAFWHPEPEQFFEYHDVHGEFTITEATRISQVQSWMQWVDGDSDPRRPEGRLRLEISHADGTGENYEHPPGGTVPNPPER